MNVLVIGSGGREHALVWKIRESSVVGEVFCAPGNPGIQEIAECVPLDPDNARALLEFAEKSNINLTIVGPEKPLAGGIVDLFRDHGRLIMGPTQRAAQLEWSKAFAKEFMQRHGIPTGTFRVFSRSQSEEAKSYVSAGPLPVVLKADGLAAGKGVVVCRTREEAIATVREMMENHVFGKAGDTLVVEEFLEGQEASVFAICDGEGFVTLAPAQDHKRALDGDEGKNTGGMGAYAPAPVVTPDILDKVEKEIIQPTLKGMAAEGAPYTGCLYVGIMVTKGGPKVVEFNCRFGDPETQAVLPVLDDDIVELFVASCTGGIAALPAKHRGVRAHGAAVCVVLASKGYPDEYKVGFPIRGLGTLNPSHDVVVFHAGTRLDGKNLVTAGGRVLGVTAIRRDGSISGAIEDAYEAVRKISFEGMHYRRDIGRKALAH